REKKMSQSKLSRLADVSLNTIQTIYHDPYHDVLLSTLERLAKALSVNVSDLYEVLPDDKPPAASL
ncbi:MAG: helix-turn-helix transcriptional regulator, partial [Chloroflexi bacterium]|nr:helix-turn-helix transcriptional regulator [Chloroflexota bacterium]